MRRYLLSLMVVFCVFCSVLAEAQNSIVLYGGEDPAAKGMTLGGWGAGFAAKSNEQLFNGSSSIKILSQGFYAGGRIDFAQPLPMPAATATDSRYLIFTFFFPQTRTINPADGTIFAYDVDPYKLPLASRMRFVFTSSDGRSISVVSNCTPVDPDDGWMRITIPLAKFKDLSNFNVSRLIIFADQTNSIFYLGEIKIVEDKEPIRVEPLDSQVIAVMDQVFFSAKATAGVSNLKYNWDFDTSDSIKCDSSDIIAGKFYVKGGKYDVALTVSDADGIKAPVTVKATIEVNE